MTDWWNSDPNAQARAGQAAGVQDIYRKVDYIDDDLIKTVDKMGPRDESGGLPIWSEKFGDQVRPYSDEAKSIVRKIIANKHDPDVREVLDQYHVDIKNATKGLGGAIKDNELTQGAVKNMVRDLTEQLVQEAAEMGKLKPDIEMESYMNLQSSKSSITGYEKTTVNAAKMRKALVKLGVVKDIGEE